MLRGVWFVVCGAVAIASGCGSHHTVEVTLQNASFGTTGGNLFNCTTPDRPANVQSVSRGPIVCEPERASDGTFTTTPVTILEQMSCGDGHGAIVSVTCAGTGTGYDVTVTVGVSISASCGSNASVGADPQTFVFQDVAPGTTLVSPTLASCAVFDNLCPTSNDCAFNAWSADISITNAAR
jgi:hypothetical protein